MSAFLKISFVFFLSTLLTYLYLWPAPVANEKGWMLGMGWDDLSLPYIYSWASQLFYQTPLAFLNGTLYSPYLGAPVGSIFWTTYLEKILVPLFSLFAKPEQLSFYYVFSQHIFTIFLGFLLGRKLNLHWVVSFGLGACISFTPFTYWRDIMHTSLSGVYAIPALLLAYLFLSQARKKTDYFYSIFFLLLILTANMYIILICLSILPFLWGVFFIKGVKSKKIYGILVLIPFLCSLLWMRSGIFLGFDGVKESQSLFEAPIAPRRAWDLLVYSAKPIDYITGNYNFETLEWNPLRKIVTRSVYEKYKNDFYPQEKSSGVRWIFLVALFLIAWKWKEISGAHKKIILLGLGVAFISFIFSLSPRAVAPLGRGIMPSQLIHFLVPQMRCPNRWSIGVQVGLTLAGFVFYSQWIQKIKSLKWKNTLLYLLAFVAIFEFPPPLNYPSYAVEPVLKTEKNCGFGIFLPYHVGTGDKTARSYVRFRGTDCQILNGQQSTADGFLMSKFSEDDLLKKSLQDPAWEEARKLLECMKVQWIFLENHYKKESICQKLGFDFLSGEFCERKSKRDSITVKEWRACLPENI